MPETKPKTRYVVHSVNSGAQICGPYSTRKEAEREHSRLAREAAGVFHRGRPQRYEVRTLKGLVV